MSGGDIADHDALCEALEDYDDDEASTVHRLARQAAVCGFVAPEHPTGLEVILWAERRVALYRRLQANITPVLDMLERYS